MPFNGETAASPQDISNSPIGIKFVKSPIDELLAFDGFRARHGVAQILSPNRRAREEAMKGGSKGSGMGKRQWRGSVRPRRPLDAHPFRSPARHQFGASSILVKSKHFGQKGPQCCWNKHMNCMCKPPDP